MIHNYKLFLLYLYRRFKDKYIGKTIKLKNKMQTNYLNNEFGDQFTLEELVEARIYSNVFTKAQLSNKNLDDVVFGI